MFNDTFFFRLTARKNASKKALVSVDQLQIIKMTWAEEWATQWQIIDLDEDGIKLRKQKTKNMTDFGCLFQGSLS